MRSTLVAFVLAACVAAALTPIVRLLALRVGAVATPSPRHVHARPIPRLGGVAICIALFAPVVGLFLVESVVAELFRQQTLRVVGLFVGGTAMCALGVVDDTRGLRNLYKLYAQIAVAVGAFYCGFRIDAVVLPLFGNLPMGVFALPVTVFWIVGIVNAVNLIDGLDGLAAGVAFFAGVTNLVVAHIAGAGMPALLMAAMLGSLLGFLIYNFNPARIFMGDSGSYFLGYVLAVTSLAGASQKASTAVALLVPILALGVPIFDTLFAIVRRFLERRPIFSPDRGHIHHRLLDAGITHRRAVLIIYGLSVLFTAAAIALYLGRSWEIGVALVMASAVIVVIVRFLGYFSTVHLRGRQKRRLRSRDTEFLRYILPTLPEKLAATSDGSELFQTLCEAVEGSDLTSIELYRVGDPKAEPVHAWSDGKGGSRRIIAVASYPLGRDTLARGIIKFCGVNDFDDGHVSMQSEILLQVLADIYTSNLARLGSDLAPRQGPEAEDASQQPERALFIPGLARIATLSRRRANGDGLSASARAVARAYSRSEPPPSDDGAVDEPAPSSTPGQICKLAGD